MVAVDWGLIANEGMDEWRKALAEAADTTIDRVSVHELNIHDAPGYDPTTERILKDIGLAGQIYDEAFARDTIRRVAERYALRSGNPLLLAPSALAKVKSRMWHRMYG